MRARGLSGTLAALLCVGPAGAEEPAGREPEIAYDEEIVVIGVRAGRLEPMPAVSSNVIFTDAHTAEHKDLADLLSESEGVHVRRFGAAGDRAELSIRGSSPSQVVVTFDGVRANSVLTGGFDLSTACLPLLERVEIIRGAGSTQEGTGAIGGVVNLVTRGAEPGRDVTRAAFSAGAFETYEGHAVHSGWLGRMDYTVGYCGLGTEGDFEFARPTDIIDGVEIGFEPDSATRINNDRVRHGGTLALSYPVAGGLLRFTDYAAYSSGGEPGIDSGNGVTAGQATEARSRDTSNLGQLRWEGPSPFGIGEDFQLALHHRYESTRFRDPAVLDREPIDVDVRLQTTGASAEDAWRYAWQSHRNLVGLHMDFAHDFLRGGDQDAQDRARAGGALTETLRLFDERVVLSVSARVDWADGFGAKLLPAAGLVLEPLPWLRLRGHAGRAYRVPNFDELFHPDEGFIRGNPDLDPEDAWNFDAGLELHLDEVGPFSAVKLRGAWFRREIEDSIVWVLINPRTVAPINTGAATAEGFELAASLQATRFVHLSASHTRVDSRRDRNGARLPGEPREQTFGRLQLGPEETWKLVGEVQHVGEIVAMGSRRITPRTVWNARAALDLAAIRRLPFEAWFSELWISGAVENIGDRAVRDAISFPQPGRRATVGIEARW